MFPSLIHTDLAAAVHHGRVIATEPAARHFVEVRRSRRSIAVRGRRSWRPATLPAQS
jgi:hypothetical protein